MVSLAVHLAIFVALALWTYFLPKLEQPRLSLAVAEPEAEPLPPDFHFSATPADRVGMAGSGRLLDARAAAPNLADVSELRYELEPSAPIAPLEVADFDRTLFEAPRVMPDVMVKGAGSVGTSAATGAIDRLTHEIMLSLEERPTLVVWLFDQSRSLSAQRESIARRFDHVYDELGVIEAGGAAAFKRHSQSPLLTSIAAFGVGVQLLTPRPTDSLDEIKAGVRAVRDDVAGNGRENVYQSVRYLAERFRTLRLAAPRRNVMIVVFTDEAGDDIEFLDAAVDVCRKQEMPVFVVGVPAPFGREAAFVKYVDPDPNFDQTPQKQDVHQGPESLLPERIKLLFGASPQEEEQFDSGFGPFGLCRLAFETGGAYFTVHPNREVGRRIAPWETAAMSTYLTAFFDPRVMRNYRPDYVSARQYRELISANGARAALIQAAQLPWVSIDNVQRRFPKLEDAQFAADLSNAQRVVAKVEPEVNRLVAILKQGDNDREKLTEPRWRAGFDLAYGQALAFQVRTQGYNAMLAAAKQGMRFENERSDTWELRPSEEIKLSTALANDAKTAREYLERVVADHPGTPWALIATRELSVPIGWEWRERFSNLAQRQARTNDNAVPVVQPSGPPPKPRRPPPEL
jgi:hypothetical protein